MFPLLSWPQRGGYKQRCLRQWVYYRQLVFKACISLTYCVLRSSPSCYARWATWASNVAVDLHSASAHAKWQRVCTRASIRQMILLRVTFATNNPTNSQQRMAEEVNNSGVSSPQHRTGTDSSGSEFSDYRPDCESDHERFQFRNSGVVHRSSLADYRCDNLILGVGYRSQPSVGKIVFEPLAQVVCYINPLSADLESNLACRQAAERLHIRSHPRVVVNPFLSSPCLLGLLAARNSACLKRSNRQAMSKPFCMNWLTSRNNWLWTLIGRVAQSILWCQPMVWWLHRGLSVAKEVCNDYVLEHHCDRQALQQLLQIAELSRPRHIRWVCRWLAFAAPPRRCSHTRYNSCHFNSTGKWFVAFAQC